MCYSHFGFGRKEHFLCARLNQQIYAAKSEFRISFRRNPFVLSNKFVEITEIMTFYCCLLHSLFITVSVIGEVQDGIYGKDEFAIPSTITIFMSWTVNMMVS